MQSLFFLIDTPLPTTITITTTATTIIIIIGSMMMYTGGDFYGSASLSDGVGWVPFYPQMIVVQETCHGGDIHIR